MVLGINLFGGGPESWQETSISVMGIFYRQVKCLKAQTFSQREFRIDLYYKEELAPQSQRLKQNPSPVVWARHVRDEAPHHKHVPHLAVYCWRETAKNIFLMGTQPRAGHRADQEKLELGIKCNTKTSSQTCNKRHLGSYSMNSKHPITEQGIHYFKHKECLPFNI